MSGLTDRITDYLASGGLFNPEMANHESVRDLLIDCRDALAARAAQAERMARLEVALRKANRRLLIEHGCHDPQDLRCKSCQTMSEIDALLRAKAQAKEQETRG